MEKMSCAQRIRQGLTVRGMRQKDLCKATGIPKSAVSQYCSGSFTPRPDRIALIAKALDVNEAWLMGYHVRMERESPEAPPLPGAFPINPTHKIPLLGQIAAGLPIYAEENIEGYLWTDRNHGAEYFGLRVRGDSMNAAGINDGDIVIVKKQDIVEDGAIAVVLVDESATIKRYRLEKGIVILTPQSTNPENQVQFYNLKEHTIKILGRIVESRTEY